MPDFQFEAMNEKKKFNSNNRWTKRKSTLQCTCLSQVFHMYLVPRRVNVKWICCWRCVDHQKRNENKKFHSLTEFLSFFYPSRVYCTLLSWASESIQEPFFLQVFCFGKPCTLQFEVHIDVETAVNFCHSNSNRWESITDWFIWWKNFCSDSRSLGKPIQDVLESSLNQLSGNQWT